MSHPITMLASPPRGLLLALALLALSGAARAEFHPEEIEDRSWDYSPRYFFDVLSFRNPLRWQEAWDRSLHGYRMELGSVVTDEFHLLQEARVVETPADWLRVGFSFLEGEDFDARFRRTRLEAGFAPAPGLEAGLYTEVDPFKEWIDLGFAASGEIPGLWRGRMGLTLVDAVFDRKADAGGYGSPPLALNLDSTLIRPGGGAYANLEATVDFPLELDLPDDRLVFRFRRTRLGFRAGAEPAPGWELRLSARTEWTRKHRNHDAYDPGDARSARVRRDAAEATLEGVRAWRRDDGFEETVAAGIHWFQILESWDFGNDPAGDRRLWKRDFVLYGSAKALLSPPLYAEGALYLGRIEHDDHFHAHPGDDFETFHPLALRLGFRLGFWFGQGMEIVPFFYLKGAFTRRSGGRFPFEAAFGGGGVNVQLLF